MTRRATRARRLVVAGLLAALAVGCGSDGTDTARPPVSTSDGDAATPVTVSAASSLATVFPAIARGQSSIAPSLNFGSSATLVAQIQSGAPVDVVATADRETMATLARSGRLAGRARVFARNRMVIVTKPGNPRDITTLADLRRADVVALCAEEAPCGRYAAAVLGRAGVALAEDHVTRQVDAASTVAAVSRGDADAAIVYTTDARAAGRAVTTVPIASRVNVVAHYPIAVLAGARDRGAARRFVALVVGPDGRRRLAAAGFLAP